MAKRYLIDTAGVIKYLNEYFPYNGLVFIDNIIDHESLISFITKIELLVWNPSNPDDLKVYHSFVSGSSVIGINEEIIQETIQIRKNYNLKLPDAIIAATAISNDCTLISDNDKDFLKIPSLEYINPQSI